MYSSTTGSVASTAPAVMMRELEDVGRRLPDDVAVIGVDDIALSALVRPALTTIRIDRQQMGARAVEMGMQLRGDPDGPPDGKR